MLQNKKKKKKEEKSYLFLYMQAILKREDNIIIHEWKPFYLICN